MEKPKLHKCPKCGRVKGAEIVYGYPMEEIVPFIEAGLLLTGGCMREGADTDYHCRACGHGWNKNHKTD